MAVVIPIFPLTHVLLPGMPLPLHVFEPRYREMLADLTTSAHGASFGVIALRSGDETLSRTADGTDPDVERIGTLAEILETEAHPDGSTDVLAVGSRRFAIMRLIADGAAYLRAEVSYLDEAAGDLAGGQQERAGRLFKIYDSILLRVAGRATGGDLPTDAHRMAYEICARLPLPPHERQALLNDESLADRLGRVARLLHREIALLQNTHTIAVSPAALRVNPSMN